MYCNCRPEAQIEMIISCYPDPELGILIYNWLCCGCGRTEPIKDGAK